MRWVIAWLFAALSANVQEWGKGPAQWLMTHEEERAWGQLRTDQEANDFVDLFWARRDPTPGTERNEFKEEFDRRVASADRQFRTDRKRGAMSDMGRVYIVIGPPLQALRSPEKMYQRNRSRRWRSTQFVYDAGVAGSVGVVKPIVFIEDPVTHELMIDPQLSNAFGTMTTVVERNVIHGELTAAPEWALHGGVDAKPRSFGYAVAKDAPKKGRISAMAVPVLDGAKQLLLVTDVARIQPQSGNDPFATLTAQATFQKSEDLGYVFQLCRAMELEGDVRVAIAISGAGGVMRAPAEEMTPEPIRALPGCSIVRGALALSDFEAGQYRFSVSVEDPAAKQTYNLTQDFRIE
ncbi:MAG TPA: GWxTD domain-containing protein [Thermoanaerobaculia bacterium]|jgi:GWxTD domain-containing protein|nr:GWxTD domain-containing protein [Thermoanaerobaculia bacterium]